jgi:hypothetical protein
MSSNRHEIDLRAAVVEAVVAERSIGIGRPGMRFRGNGLRATAAGSDCAQ